MTNQGGRQPPPDDRTLLDPLNADELKALREARQKMQASKSGSAVAHQIVIGPDGGEDIGDAPTRAMPALPQFESQGVSLDRIPTAEGRPAQPGRGAAPGGPPPQGGRPHAPTPQPPMAGMPPVPHVPPAGHGSGPLGSPSGQTAAGPTGFGENTLLWMAPPKAAPSANPTGVVSAADLKKAKAAAKKSRMMAIGAGAVVLALIGSLVVVLRPRERAQIELVTTPSHAKVKIDGELQPAGTPLKLKLFEGKVYDVEVSLDGYKTEAFQLKPGIDPSRIDKELEPISEAGKMTVSISIQPIASNITVDDKTYGSKKSINIANLDPKAPHKIKVEAGGYKLIDRDIPAGQLEKSYVFSLTPDETKKLGE